MRVTSTDLEILRSTIAPLDTAETRDAYRTGNFPRAELVKDLNKRYRGDLLRASRAAWHLTGEDYTDAHLDTALRAIVPAL